MYASLMQPICKFGHLQLGQLLVQIRSHKFEMKKQCPDTETPIVFTIWTNADLQCILRDDEKIISIGKEYWGVQQVWIWSSMWR